LTKSLAVIEVEVSRQTHFCVCDRLIIVEINLLILDCSPQPFDKDVVENATPPIPTDGNIGNIKRLVNASQVN